MEAAKTDKIKIRKKRSNVSNRLKVNINKKSKFKDKFKKRLKEKRIKKFTPGKERDEIDKAKLKKYDRGQRPDAKMVKVKIEQKKLAKREEKIKFGLEQSVRSEVLLTEESGFLEPSDDEITAQFTQSNIKDSVDLLSASKRFDLELRNFGPYRMNYTRNGRFLLLGGQRGHLAALDWITKKLLCEINVMESIYDVAWLHQETLYAVAQKKWVYVYDNQGTEIHCIKKLFNVIRMMFLPYHFLLATVSSEGFISWLDVSVGQMVENFRIQRPGTAASVAMHPGNAMIAIGEPTGAVSFWGPNSHKPSITKQCHKSPISAIAFHPKSLNFATSGVDSTVKIWDARSLKGPYHNYFLRCTPNNISLSGRGLMALSLHNIIEVYCDTTKEGQVEKKVYLRHKVPRMVSNMEFCPFEDVLGVAHSSGFTSMLVPGSGEPNFDALEINPFQTKSQRRETEVKALLGKIPPDLITWDSSELRKLDIPSLEEIIEAKKQIAYIKPPDIQFTPRPKKGKQAGSANAAHRKKIMKEDFRRNYVKQMKELKGESKQENQEKNKSTDPVLDRFKVRQKN